MESKRYPIFERVFGLALDVTAAIVLLIALVVGLFLLKWLWFLL